MLFLQHLIGGGEHDENRKMFGSRYQDIIEAARTPKKEVNADEIRNRIIEKSKLLTGEIE